MSQAGHQRYQGKNCQQTFTQTKGTFFYRRHVAEIEILKALAQRVEGSRISRVSRTTGHKEDTILAGLWAYVGNQAEKTLMPKQLKQGSSGARP